ncbi:DUF5682 family protein [Streptomyces oceani]|uniref:DUF5682 family protein n=1 Tax=Streptomyces oceani TaxID=1075402 RepID=UPI000871DDD5|nr:DUF5682 family protein [Streptomyces oceani]
MTGGDRATPGPLLLGVRHHGPGSARAVRAALAAYEPRVLLVEGPPEAEDIVEFAAEEGMRPPVALLAHARDEAGKAAFWPLAEFSPEWVAIRWALGRGVPVRFIDLPAAHSLAMGQEPGGTEVVPPGDPAGAYEPAPGAPSEQAPSEQVPQDGTSPADDRLRGDPLAVLADAAGYDDPERWWEDVVEHRAGADRTNPYAPFHALQEAMTALRETPESGDGQRDRVREAHMRLRLREAVREHGADGVAVVCGAWHVPALATGNPVGADRRLLKGLPRTKTEITWVPWTHRRLARHSGYGAGITSPGWYGHLFAAPDRPLERWMTRVAALLREEDWTVSPAHVIEAVRMAETLAAMRGRPLAGLAETVDAVRAVLCEGSDVPLSLIRERLIVGDELGEVPDTVPVVPLQRDLARQQRSLRLKAEARQRDLELDLRRDMDVARSRLLHRLRLLDVRWGEPVRSSTGNTGTFRESWRLSWEPELLVRIAEAGVWGTTVSAAASAKARARALDAGELAELTTLAERCLLAELPDALPVVMRALADRAAVDSDVAQLIQALPPLVRSVRYGDVRGTEAAAPAEVALGLSERICVGLPAACSGLDPDGAAFMRGRLDTAHEAIALFAQSRAEAAGLRDRWREVLRKLALRDRVPGLIRGRCVRLLLDDGQLPGDDAARLMSLALSPGVAPAEAAAWIEGFLAGGGMLLVHDRRLLELIDGWLTRVSAETFTDVLPLLRRTFADFEAGVRRTLGEVVRRTAHGRIARTDGAGGAAGAPEPFGAGPALDTTRADAVLPVLRELLGAEQLSGAAATLQIEPAVARTERQLGRAS